MRGKKIAAYVVGHLPIVKAYAIKIGLVDIINRLVPSKMDVEPGIIFLGMIMDTLSGRTPLYRLDEFFQDQDTELLLGKRINPSVFNDYNVGRVLDKAYEIGSIKIFTVIAKNAVDVFDVNTPHVSFDMIIKIGDNRRLNKPFTKQQMEYLVALKVNPNAFIKPGAG